MSETREAVGAVHALLKEVAKVVIGKEGVLEQVALGLIADGNILLEDNPGVAKTLTVNTFARAAGLSFRRIQFTPDLLPADITGSFYFNLQANRFELRRGPIFANFILADEINRAPPKTQSALLEAMQERQTTLEGETHPLPRPFFVFATQNPIEIEGTYPLPEAQLDRFLMRLGIGYPSRAAEMEMLRRKERAEPEIDVVFDADRLALVQRVASTVRLDDANKDYIVRLVQATREEPRLTLGASPRGSVALLRLAKAHALLRGRGFVVPDDVKAVAIPALAHRLVLAPDARVRGISSATIVRELLSTVATPPVPRVVARTLPDGG